MARLKRVILIGDHHQLPPVVKNMAFQKYSHLDQSLFTRFVRLGTPYVQLNAQVPSRSASPAVLKLLTSFCRKFTALWVVLCGECMSSSQSTSHAAAVCYCPAASSRACKVKSMVSDVHQLVHGSC